MYLNLWLVHTLKLMARRERKAAGPVADLSLVVTDSRSIG